jgi:flagellar basal-body rod modification protein FlgD
MTSPIASTSSSSAASALQQAAGSSGVLDKEAFLKLLVQQLKSQSPLDPVSNEDFVAQLAQFSSLESAQQTNDRVGELVSLAQLGQGAALVGRRVTYLDPESGEQLPGIVSAVETRGDSVVVDVGGVQVPLDHIFRVDAASTGAPI